MNFFIALAVNHRPNIALEIIQQTKLKSYSTLVQSVRLEAFAEIGRFEDAFDILRFQLSKDKASNTYKVVYQESVSLFVFVTNFSQFIFISKA